MEPVSETARLLGIDLEWWILGVGLLTLVAGLWVAVVQHLIWRRPATHIAFSDEWEINGPIDDRRVEVSADVAALGRVMVASARAYLCIGFRDRVLLERMFDQVGKAWEGERIGFMFRIPKDYGGMFDWIESDDWIVEVQVKLRDGSKAKFKQRVETATRH